MNTRYKEFKGLHLPQIEAEILEHWAKNNTFEQSVLLRNDAPAFVFFEGPPSANGMPGIHHVISRTLKDLVCRYKTMQGFKVDRKGGWDTHGLPVELGVEKELGITKEDIGTGKKDKFGNVVTVAYYNQKCREAVLRYKDLWDDITRKMGYWVDLEHPYITYENNYIESVWWLLKKMYNRGLLYESVSIQPYSPAAGTGLSSHELNQPGTYKDVKDTSATVMFRAIQNNASKFLHDAVHGSEVFFMAWTTTPWTLPANLALSVGPNINYVLVQTFNPYTHLPVHVVLAEALVLKYLKPEGENGNFDTYSKEDKIIPWRVVSSFKGSDIENCTYEQLLPFEANSLTVIQSITPNAQPFRVLLADFVTTQDGTGIVHTAPAFGADDFKVGKSNNIGILIPVDRAGKFVEGLGEFSGRFVKNYKDDSSYIDVNVDISVKLKLENRAFKVEKYEHSYPHCWRTDKPILYYPLDAWFIKTTALKDNMVVANQNINWKPASTGTGRFGNWLENMVDWNLSRSRFWGTPLPMWKNNHPLFAGQRTAIGSKADLISHQDPITGDYYFGVRFDLEKINASFVKNGELYKHLLKLSDDSTHTEYKIDIAYLTEAAATENGLSLQDLSKAGVCLTDIPTKFYELLTPESVAVLDLHRPFIDTIAMVKKDGNSILSRVTDLIDVWFDSGAMPYAQWHFPFENVQKFANNYPADFIAEGVDQTRGWFYTLHAIGSLIKEDIKATLQSEKVALPTLDGRAYKTVVSNGLVLDKNGNKMSKRLGNVIDPFTTIETYGADATRWYLITNASPWDNLKFDIKGIEEVQRKFFGTLFNTYQFFVLYANVDGFCGEEKEIPLSNRPEIDRWIISSLNTLKLQVTAAMDDYEPTQAGRLIGTFVDEHLSNWYVRLSRRRFWRNDIGEDKLAAYQTLYECLETLLLLMAPIAPFFSDSLFIRLNEVTGKHQTSSVHHVLYPKPAHQHIDVALEERMQLAQIACSLVLSIRKKVNIKVRQPLQKILIPVLNPAMMAQLQLVEDLIKAEVNVKEVDYLEATNGFIKKKAKPDYALLGKKLGTKMKAVNTALSTFTSEQIKALETNGTCELVIDNEVVTIALSEVEIQAEDIPGWSVASSGALTVALDITLTEELLKEGNAREFVNRLQNIRKDTGLEVTDTIIVHWQGDEKMETAIKDYEKYICTEILAVSLLQTNVPESGIEIEVDGTQMKVFVQKHPVLY